MLAGNRFCNLVWMSQPNENCVKHMDIQYTLRQQTQNEIKTISKTRKKWEMKNYAVQGKKPKKEWWKLHSTCSPSSSLTKIENKEKKNEISLLSWWQYFIDETVTITISNYLIVVVTDLCNFVKNTI